MHLFFSREVNPSTSCTPATGGFYVARIQLGVLGFYVALSSLRGEERRECRRYSGLRLAYVCEYCSRLFVRFLKPKKGNSGVSQRTYCHPRGEPSGPSYGPSQPVAHFSS